MYSGVILAGVLFVILEKRGKGCVLNHEQKLGPFPLCHTYILSYIGREGYKVSE